MYSASKLATEEFPNFDVGQRSAASIARRLQDPLAELVKIDPKSIGVGQYQHDMNQKKLSEALTGVVEDCVNRVGVDLNTASASLLEYISGISKPIAKNIVAYREANWPIHQPQTAVKSGASWGRRPLSSAPDSCASPAGTIRWMPPACTRRATRRPRGCCAQAGLSPRRMWKGAALTGIVMMVRDEAKICPKSWRSARSH